MTKKQTQSVQHALNRLMDKGISYRDVLAFVAGQGRETGAFTTLVHSGLGTYTVYVGGEATKTTDVDEATRIFTEATRNVEGLITPAKEQGAPFSLDPAESARVAKELNATQPPGIRR